MLDFNNINNNLRRTSDPKGSSDPWDSCRADYLDISGCVAFYFLHLKNQKILGSRIITCSCANLIILDLSGRR